MAATQNDPSNFRRYPSGRLTRSAAISVAHSNSPPHITMMSTPPRPAPNHQTHLTHDCPYHSARAEIQSEALQGQTQ